jgi:hypothetical protein
LRGVLCAASVDIKVPSINNQKLNDKLLDKDEEINFLNKRICKLEDDQIQDVIKVEFLTFKIQLSL